MAHQLAAAVRRDFPTQPPVTNAPSAAPPGRWPIDDNEGPHTLYMWLGADFSFPDWVSCSDHYCIVGVEDRVRLFDLSDGIADLGWLPLGTPDPTQQFVEAGIPAGDVRAFMTPGPP